MLDFLAFVFSSDSFERFTFGVVTEPANKNGVKNLLKYLCEKMTISGYSMA